MKHTRQCSLVSEDLEWLWLVKLASVCFGLRKSRQSESGCFEKRDLQPMQVSGFLYTSGACALVKAVSDQVCIHSRNEKYENHFVGF